MRKMGVIQQMILLLLVAGAALSVTRSPRQYYRLVGRFGHEWKNIKKSSVERSIARLHESKMLDLRLQKDGTWKMELSDHGKRRALYYKIETMTIRKPKRWDGRWRVIIFDIPEKERGARDGFRAWIKRLGFLELQKSVFILPYDCRDEFDFIVEFLGIRRYVRYMVVEEIDNQEYVEERFFSTSQKRKRKK
jgi:DNA-binding transcriptional regulator PaaX